jgi:hypothetical protein
MSDLNLQCKNQARRGAVVNSNCNMTVGYRSGASGSVTKQSRKAFNVGLLFSMCNMDSQFLFGSKCNFGAIVPVQNFRPEKNEYAGRESEAK